MAASRPVPCEPDWSLSFLMCLASPGEGGPLRCEMCRAYINSFAKYVQNGEKVRWQLAGSALLCFALLFAPLNDDESRQGVCCCFALARVGCRTTALRRERVASRDNRRPLHLLVPRPGAQLSALSGRTCIMLSLIHLSRCLSGYLTRYRSLS